jgi:NAD(P)-dependent dehydrogenase (short-subunit alcohol dehydrogenase family)
MVAFLPRPFLVAPMTRVAIVGGAVAGTSLAYHLGDADADLDVTLYEKSGLGSETTSASMALFMWQRDHPAAADLRTLFDVNVVSPMLLSKAVLEDMERHGTPGALVHVSSIATKHGYEGLSMYGATKGAIEAFTRSLRLELGDENVSCTLMQPPMSDTRMTADLGYPDWLLADPADVGRKLAGKIESTAPVVAADWQTKVGLALIQRFPSIWAKATERYVSLDE